MGFIFWWIYKFYYFAINFEEKENKTLPELNNTEYLNSSFFENYFQIFENYLKIICEIQDDGANETQSDQIKLYILKYVYPIILVFGVLGNVVSLTVMIKIYTKKRGLYGFTLNLAALSLADLAVLIFGCFREYSDVILDWRLRSMNLFMCKLFYFSCYFFSCFCCLALKC